MTGIFPSKLLAQADCNLGIYVRIVQFSTFHANNYTAITTTDTNQCILKHTYCIIYYVPSIHNTHQDKMQ